MSAPPPPSLGGHEDKRRERRERRLILWALALLLASPLLLLFGWFGLVEAPARSRAKRLALELQERTEALGARGWERPVLRGTPRPGNASEEAHRWALAIGVPSHLSFDNVLAGAQPPDAATRRLLAEKAKELNAFQASTQMAAANLPDSTFAPGRKGEVSSILHLRAVRLLLVRALDLPPRRCLQTSADAIRLAQDHVPGGGIVRVAVAAAEISSATLAALRCATRASATELDDAASEFARLAEHVPPLGDALEAETLYESVVLHGTFAMRPILPKLFGSRLDRATTEPWTLLDAWQESLVHAARLRELNATAYPETLDELNRLVSAQRASPNPLVAAPALPGRIDLVRHVERDAAANAKLRALSLAMQVLATRSHARPVDALPGRKLEHLLDPFTGTELRVTTRATGHGVVYSVGPNRRDDQAAPASDDIALELSPD